MSISGITPVKATPLAESQSVPVPAQREVSQTQADDFAKAVLAGIVSNIAQEAQRHRDELKQIMEEEN